eukprot:PhF_6_TR25878/c0_g1_i1/m.36586
MIRIHWLAVIPFAFVVFLIAVKASQTLINTQHHQHETAMPQRRTTETTPVPVQHIVVDVPPIIEYPDVNRSHWTQFPTISAENLRSLTLSSIPSLPDDSSVFQNPSCFPDVYLSRDTMAEAINATLAIANHMRYCFDTFSHDDTRTREQIVEALLGRAQKLRTAYTITPETFLDMAKVDDARNTMVEIRHPNVNVIGGFIDPIRSVPILDYLTRLVKRSPKERFPDRIILFIDTADHTESSLPLFALYALPDPKLPLPKNYLFLDETFLVGHGYRKSGYSAFVKEIGFPASKQQWLSTRANKVVFFGRPTHRLRLTFHKTVETSKCAACNITVNWAGQATSKHSGRGSAVPPREYARYQTAFMIRGKSASNRDKDLLATGNAIVRLVDFFLEPSQFVHDLLIPYVHYLPIWYRVQDKLTWSRKRGLPYLDHFGDAMKTFASHEFDDIRYRLANNNRKVAQYLGDQTVMDDFVIGLIGEYQKAFAKNVVMDDAFVRRVSEVHLAAEKKRESDILAGKSAKKKLVYQYRA